VTSNKSSDPLAGVIQTITLGMSLALGIWGTWLLGTDDPDGGRRPMSGIMLRRGGCRASDGSARFMLDLLMCLR